MSAFGERVPKEAAIKTAKRHGYKDADAKLAYVTTATKYRGGSWERIWAIYDAGRIVGLVYRRSDGRSYWVDYYPAMANYLKIAGE